jgi:arylsulfatase A-like enzyme
VPYLTGKNSDRPHDALYWRFGQQWAIRQGDYKLLKPMDGPVQMFNLASDVGEQKDIAAEKPDLRKDLEAAYAIWTSQLEEPRWKNARAGRAANNRANGKARQRARNRAAQ